MAEEKVWGAGTKASTLSSLPFYSDDRKVFNGKAGAQSRKTYGGRGCAMLDQVQRNCKTDFPGSICEVESPSFSCHDPSLTSVLALGM